MRSNGQASLLMKKSMIQGHHFLFLKSFSAPLRLLARSLLRIRYGCASSFSDQ